MTRWRSGPCSFPSGQSSPHNRPAARADTCPRGQLRASRRCPSHSGRSSPNPVGAGDTESLPLPQTLGLVIALPAPAYCSCWSLRSSLCHFILSEGTPNVPALVDSSPCPRTAQRKSTREGRREACQKSKDAKGNLPI